MEHILHQEEMKFRFELKSMKNQLTILDKQRDELIKNMRAKYREKVKNADDALAYVSEYIKLTIWFSYSQEENNIYLFSDAKVMDNWDEIKFKELFKELCDPYMNVIGGWKDDLGYHIQIEKK